jgi:exosortase
LTNEQYAYGWFVPLFAAYSFWVRWERRPEPQAVGGFPLVIFAMSIGALFLLLPVRLFEVAVPDWRLPLWIHACVAGGLTLLLLWQLGGTRWIRHFAFPIAFFFVAVPWPLRIEEPLVQSLMRIVASVSAEAITLFGIPAQVQGNLIRVNAGLVGVNEACSGVRSLQTSLMIGLLLGELKLLPWRRRMVLLFVAIAIALTANFGRSFFLVWIEATRGAAAVYEWHDTIGISIVVVVFLGSLLLLYAITPKAVAGAASSKTRSATESSRLAPTFALGGALAWLVCVEGGVEAWYRSHETGTVPQPHWTVQWPERQTNFRQGPLDEYVHRQLHNDFGGEATWENASSGDRYAGFFIRWNAGFSSVLRARAHRPEICLPGAGWQQTGDYGVKRYPVAPGLELSFRHFAFREPSTKNSVFASAFFCVSEDRSVPNSALVRDAESRPTDSVIETARHYAAMVRAGIRNPGQQVLELVIVTSRPILPAEAESKLAALLPQIIRSGTPGK